MTITYLWYPDFDAEGHPSLVGGFIVYLDTQQVRYRDYSQVENPPVLHRKEEFVLTDYPGRDRFSQLTDREEAIGLYASPSTIGTKLGWTETLAAKRVTIAGHEVISMPSA